MNIEEILDDIDDLLDNSHPIPFASHKVIIDADRLRELLSAAHLNIPAEIKRAKMIDADCNRIINNAKDEAERIVQDAEARAKQLISQEAIQAQAKRQALDLLTKAQNGSNAVKQAAESYVNNLLDETLQYFQKSLQELQQTKNKIDGVKK